MEAGDTLADIKAKGLVAGLKDAGVLPREAKEVGYTASEMNSYGNVAVEVGRVEVWQVEVGFGRPRPILRKHARVFSLGWFGYGVKRRCSAREAVEGGRSWAEDSAIGVRDLVFARVCVCWMLHPLVGAEP